MEAYTGLDAIGFYLSGGVSNYIPSDSLGGEISSNIIKGMNPVYSTSIQGLIIEDITPENGEGEAQIAIDESGNATYTPPDGLAGDSVLVAVGEWKILLGADTTKAVRIFRESGSLFLGVTKFTLVDMLQGVFSLSNVDNAERVAGSVLYRAFFVKVLAEYISTTEISTVLLWITTDGQSSWALAAETPDSTDTIQDISDETVAPTGLSWVVATSEGTALQLDDSLGLGEDETIGVWVRRTFPSSGVVDIKEQISFHFKFDYVE